MSDAPVSVPWRAQPGPQLEAIKMHNIPELFFGGARGGGKSDFLLGDYGQDLAQYGQHWQGIIFRKSYPQLEELLARSRQIYPAWFPGAEFQSGNFMWKWPNGSTLKFRHLEHDDDWTAYQGHSFTFIGFDELPQWATPKVYNELKAMLRNGAMKIPNKRIRSTGNPGGAGHGWIKTYFGIDMYPNGSVLIPPKVEGGNAKIFVKSSVSDNKILLANDPGYIARLRDLGDETLVQMYLEGRWDVVAGAFFPEWNPAVHVIRPFEIPKDWMRFRAMDWGSAAPFCVHWYAVSDGSMPEYPRGAMICYREWYGAKPAETGEWIGLKMTAEEVGDGIRGREENDKLDMSVIDPSAFKEDGGPSIASRMSTRKVYFQKADNARRPGWDAVRQRLKGNVEGQPMLYFFSSCPHIIRTLPIMQHDTGSKAGAIEDVDTKSEDHAVDTLRYACMSRPWVKPSAQTPKPVNHAGMIHSRSTFNELVAQARRRRIEAEDG